MGLKILIVEDQFIEANDLQLILEKAGHTVSGIAKSVKSALEFLKTDKPEIVLLDIFLKGSLSGIDLAPILSKNNIPFIFISANSDPLTFESAKSTRPDGFLIKPYRDLDVLVALDIAKYRHKYVTEHTLQQGRWLSDMLNHILESAENVQDKLLLLVKSFKPFIPFDHVVVDLNMSENESQQLYSFHRVSFDDYEFLEGKNFLAKLNLLNQEQGILNRDSSNHSAMKFVNGQDFVKSCLHNKLSARLAEKYGVQSYLKVPVSNENQVDISITFYSCDPFGYAKEHLKILTPLQNQLGIVLTTIKSGFGKQVRDITKSNDLRKNNASDEFKHIIGRSPKLLQALDLVIQVAPIDTSVLILGETGVGKEGLAKAIHQLSKRRNKPLIKVNCGAIPPSLIESELFGHEKGSFSGASERRIGKFEQAQGGTIFLDEIGEMPLETQTKLLRVIQEKELERIGGKATIKLDIRLITATNRNLYKEVAAGKFRIDLYYRINVFSIMLAPLRERAEDIPDLVNFFLEKHARLSKSQPKKISHQALETLLKHSWPGNIRELENVIERQIILTPSLLISSIELPDEEIDENIAVASNLQFKSMAENETEYILTALKKSNGKVSGIGGAAEMLNLPAATLVSKMKKLGISWNFVAK